MNRRVLVLPVLGVLLVAPMVAADDEGQLTASFQWRQADGLGEHRLTGSAWAVHVPLPGRPANDDPASAAFDRVPGAPVFVQSENDSPASANVVLELDARGVRVTERYIDYRSSPALAVQSSVDDEQNTYTLDTVRLRVMEARHQAQFLALAPLDEEDPDATPPATLRVASVFPEALLTAPSRLSVEMFDEPSDYRVPPELNVGRAQETANVAFAAQYAQELATVAGPITLHVWDIDLVDANQPSRVLRSGHIESGAVGANPAVPEGATYESRKQLLTLEIDEGELRFRFPGRTVEYVMAPGAIQFHTRGSWTVTEAVGELTWGETASTLDGERVHLDGTFDARFRQIGSARAVMGSWTGNAHHVSAEHISLESGIAHAAVGRAGPAPWVWALGGTFLLAGVAGIGAGALRWGQSHPRHGAAGATTEAEFAEADEVIAESISQLKEGRAQEVLDRFGSDYDAAAPSAPVQAYIMSLAHLQLGERDNAAKWVLEAIRLYPDFVHQLTVNEMFFELRDDPRIQRLLKELEAAPAEAAPAEVSGYA